jgi:hypothetical protein
MKLCRFGIGLLILSFGSVALAQNNLPRPEVAQVKSKLSAVVAAMGDAPAGYVREPEDYNLPTEFYPAQAKDKFFPISSSVSVNYTDQGIQEAQATADQASEDFEARYAAALASGDPNAIARMTQEMLRISSLSAAAAFSSEAKEDLTAYIQFNGSPYAAIDPDGVLFERPGVIALVELPERNQVVVYLDPIALRETETLSSFTLSTPDDGVSNRSGVYNITVTLDGEPDDIAAFAEGFNTDAMLEQITR